ncbi:MULTISPECIES: hypothetical protein [Nocardiopsis]|uniref:Uncharacterized protein n=1 Tax=Nocardiopsis dassonvillei (strain ATCC 23218 / DSM 43111 / CIP 107115 / JCM 7437 / KCTC 9190 / NBRC 14626 / NCTC 10488 / NRRL B-5397 / IMRU 509) TaxID=446468 RepID=D7B081_NOCDD|nr:MULTISPECIES: hypothetical protein [Nocardiopsis]ADH70169.1 conserved hypothetical protein [Nocardiopsis dassonvillei subsp. dassonvillei DSM 43111]VEI90686.1 Uncharacterised protein [Nocardiopsis dassonvillei]
MRVTAGPLVGAALAGLLLTGCGALGGGESGGGGAEGGEETSAEEARLEFAECMRDNGHEMPDPEPDSEGGVAFALPEADQEGFKEALEACEEHLPVDEDAPDQQEVFEQDLKMAECLRENGIDIPDPRPGESLTLPVDPEDDEHTEALTTCSEDVFGEGGGFGGTTGAGGGNS